jgi:hypothetical protein
VAQKEPLKSAKMLPGTAVRRWEWNGQHGIRHTVDYDAKGGITIWTVWLSQTAIYQHQPWFLVRALGEVQENVKHFKNSGLDLILANRALLAVGMIPDQHADAPWCTCNACKPVFEEETA